MLLPSFLFIVLLLHHSGWLVLPFCSATVLRSRGDYSHKQDTQHHTYWLCRSRAHCLSSTQNLGKQQVSCTAKCTQSSNNKSMECRKFNRFQEGEERRRFKETNPLKTHQAQQVEEIKNINLKSRILF